MPSKFTIWGSHQWCRTISIANTWYHGLLGNYSIRKLRLRREWPSSFRSIIACFEHRTCHLTASCGWLWQRGRTRAYPSRFYWSTCRIDGSARGWWYQWWILVPLTISSYTWFRLSRVLFKLSVFFLQLLIHLVFCIRKLLLVSQIHYLSSLEGVLINWLVQFWRFYCERRDWRQLQICGFLVLHFFYYCCSYIKLFKRVLFMISMN